MSGQQASLRGGVRPAADTARAGPGTTTFAVILSLSFCHLLNDMMQSLVPALYPILKESYALDFGQVGLITLAFQCTASLFQPVVGMVTDRRPLPYSLAVGMGSTLVGLLLMAQAGSYPVIVCAAALIGLGSAVFHPEASRVARMAAGGRYGLAQSLFQVGGNVGSASGPLLARWRRAGLPVVRSRSRRVLASPATMVPCAGARQGGSVRVDRRERENTVFSPGRSLREGVRRRGEEASA